MEYRLKQKFSNVVAQIPKKHLKEYCLGWVFVFLSCWVILFVACFFVLLYMCLQIFCVFVFSFFGVRWRT